MWIIIQNYSKEIYSWIIQTRFRLWISEGITRQLGFNIFVFSRGLEVSFRLVKGKSTKTGMETCAKREVQTIDRRLRGPKLSLQMYAFKMKRLVRHIQLCELLFNLDFSIVPDCNVGNSCQCKMVDAWLWPTLRSASWILPARRRQPGISSWQPNF